MDRSGVRGASRRGSAWQKRDPQIGVERNGAPTALFCSAVVRVNPSGELTIGIEHDQPSQLDDLANPEPGFHRRQDHGYVALRVSTPPAYCNVTLRAGRWSLDVPPQALGAADEHRLRDWLAQDVFCVMQRIGSANGNELCSERGGCLASL
jgi:hypothetical protein